MNVDEQLNKLFTDNAARQLVDSCHGASHAAGWWHDLSKLTDLQDTTFEYRVGLAFNAQRADHKLEARRAEGGKAF